MPYPVQLIGSGPREMRLLECSRDPWVYAGRLGRAAEGESEGPIDWNVLRVSGSQHRSISSLSTYKQLTLLLLIDCFREHLLIL
jgi:hypothetical protein